MLNRETTDERLGKRSSLGVMRYFSLVMSVAYIALGVYLFIASPEAFSLSPAVQQILGGVFVVYGIIRFVRAYRQMSFSRYDDAR